MRVESGSTPAGRRLDYREHGRRSLRRGVRGAAARLLGTTEDITLHCCLQLPLVYVSNAKSASSTVLQTLRKASRARDPGIALADSPYADDGALTRSFAVSRLRGRTRFSVARNPFIRALSAYLDKIQDPSDPAFRRGYDLADGEEIGFRDFLRRLSRFDRLDPHFRQQHRLLGADHFRLDACFHLERWDCFERFLGVEAATHRPHSTGAAEKLAAHYDGECVDLARAIYGRDFEEYGYSRDPEDLTPRADAIIAGRPWSGEGAPPAPVAQATSPGLRRAHFLQTLKRRGLL